MMRSTAVISLSLLALAGCPSNDGNPAVLWISPKDGERSVALTDKEPPYY